MPILCAHSSQTHPDAPAPGETHSPTIRLDRALARTHPDPMPLTYKEGVVGSRPAGPTLRVAHARHMRMRSAGSRAPADRMPSAHPNDRLRISSGSPSVSKRVQPSSRLAKARR